MAEVCLRDEQRNFFLTSKHQPLQHSAFGCFRKNITNTVILIH